LGCFARVIAVNPCRFKDDSYEYKEVKSGIIARNFLADRGQAKARCAPRSLSLREDDDLSRGGKVEAKCRTRGAARPLARSLIGPIYSEKEKLGSENLTPDIGRPPLREGIKEGRPPVS
jgi:hypothetical protein